jgi:hypothetical protein
LIAHPLESLVLRGAGPQGVGVSLFELQGDLFHDLDFTLGRKAELRQA